MPSTCGSSSPGRGPRWRSSAWPYSGPSTGRARSCAPSSSQPPGCSPSSYNVGDAHVFFLPSHLVVALLAGPALASLNTSFRGVAVPIVLVLIAVRMYAEYPALDRSEDGRPDELLSSLAEGVDDRRAVLLTELNWQIQNGMYYFAQETRPDLAYARLAEVAPHIDALLADNAAIGREVIVTERAARTLSGGEDGPFRLAALRWTAICRCSTKIRMLPAGTRYALVLLRPLREYRSSPAMMLQIAGALTSSAMQSWPGDDYVAWPASPAGRQTSSVASPPRGPRASRLTACRGHPPRRLAGLRHHQAYGIRQRDCRPAPRAHR